MGSGIARPMLRPIHSIRLYSEAKCEKLTKETGVFHVTNRERNNELYLTYLLDASGVSAYQVVNDKDGSSNHHI